MASRPVLGDPSISPDQQLVLGRESPGGHGALAVQVRVRAGSEYADNNSQPGDGRDFLELDEDSLRPDRHRSEKPNATERDIPALSADRGTDLPVGILRVDEDRGIGEEPRMDPALVQVLKLFPDLFEDR